MNDWRPETRVSYRRKGLGGRSGLGSRPALLVIDFCLGFTDPTSNLGGDFDAEVAVTQRLIERFREHELPIFFTTVAYNDDLSDGGVFIKKVPALALLKRGSEWVEIDQRLTPSANEPIIEKQFASGFFGTDLDERMRREGVDTAVVCGCTTSGCVRATAVDAMQYGYHTCVVRDAVGDRAVGPHEANLFDLDSKYADVVDSADILEAIATSAAHEAD